MNALIAGVLLLASLLPIGEAVADEAADFEQRCHMEIARLHVTIEAWMAGSIPDTDEAYASFSEAMADDFEIIAPSGKRSNQKQIIAAFRTAHGSRTADFSIAIRSIRTRMVSPPLALLTYEEWQYEGGQASARISSVLLRDDPARPGGVAWVHLQETWLPGLSPAERSL
jgi:hypothetical protein